MLNSEAWTLSPVPKPLGPETWTLAPAPEICTLAAPKAQLWPLHPVTCTLATPEAQLWPCRSCQAQLSPLSNSGSS